jgi:1-acyl-sn-glycerol-3-phosphate acyltransferase
MNSIRQSLQNKGHDIKEINSLVNKSGFINFIFLELVSLIIRKLVYRLESDFRIGRFNQNHSYVFVSNHFGHFDYLVLYSEICASEVSELNPLALASSHLNKGIFGFLFSRANVAFIHRNARNNFALIEDFLKLIGQYKMPVILFPEGTFGVSGNLKSFKKGILSIIMKQGSFWIVPTKLQTTRTFGDLNFATIRATQKWNTKESLINILKHISSILRFKGYMRVKLGQELAFEGKYANQVSCLKKAIESLAVYSSLEEEIYKIYFLLKSGYNKAEIEQKSMQHFSSIAKIFEWQKHDEKALAAIFYFSVNQFIYKALSVEERLTYEKAFFEENGTQEFTELGPSMDQHFREIAGSFRLN